MHELCKVRNLLPILMSLMGSSIPAAPSRNIVTLQHAFPFRLFGNDGKFDGFGDGSNCADETLLSCVVSR